MRFIPTPLIPRLKIDVSGQELSRLLISRLLLSSLLLLCILGCTSSGGGDSNNSSSDFNSDSGDGGDFIPVNVETLRVTTFNVGLLPKFVPFADERVPELQTALAASDTDVICLQEVWRSDDAEQLRGSLALRYPHSAIVPPRLKFATQLPVCTTDDVSDVLSCVVSNCLLGGQGIFECVSQQCEESFNQLAGSNPQCADAITAQAGKSATDILEIQDELFSDTEPAPLYPFEGSAGLLLASKYPLQNVQTLDFFDFSTTSRRAALFATVTVNGRDQTIACTHLASDLDGIIPYTGRFNSFEGESRVEAQQMISFAAGYSGPNPQSLAGDFNCSETNAATGATSDFPATCESFRAAGYSDAAGVTLRCSFCTENILNMQNATTSDNRDQVLDHVFTKTDLSTGLMARLLYTQTITIQGDSENLSDHYGVQVTIPLR